MNHLIHEAGLATAADANICGTVKCSTGVFLALTAQIRLEVC